MTLFTERQEAVRVLYKAAGQLLNEAAKDDITGCGRELCRKRAYECVELAEKIAYMGPVKITLDKATYLEVEGVPFNLGFATKIKPRPEVEDDDKG